MKAGVIQSNYVPWRGYFDFIASVDVFVVYDDVDYSKNTYRNRNQVKTARGLQWLTVPVNAHLGMAIDAVPIDPGSADWVAKHEKLLREALEPAPHFGDALRLWRDGVGKGGGLLSPMNVRLIRAICEYLGVRTRIVDARPFAARGKATERLLDLLGKLGADAYVSGPSAKDYLDEAAFRAKGIKLEYKSYDYAPYPQLHGAFAGNVTVLDLIANCGPDAPKYLRSRTPDTAAA